MDEQGNQLKENSHPFIETMTREDIVDLLGAPIEDSLFFACCLPSGGCAEMLQADCVAAGGIAADYGLSCEAWRVGECHAGHPGADGRGRAVLILLMIAFGC